MASFGLCYSNSHRSGRFRNHSISSSPVFETSPARSHTAPLCSWPQGPQVAQSSPFIFAGPWPRANVKAFSETQDTAGKASPCSGMFTSEGLLARLRHQPGAVEGKTQHARDSQTDRSGDQECSQAAPHLPSLQVLWPPSTAGMVV